MSIHFRRISAAILQPGHSHSGCLQLPAASTTQTQPSLPAYTTLRGASLELRLRTIRPTHRLLWRGQRVLMPPTPPTPRDQLVRSFNFITADAGSSRVRLTSPSTALELGVPSWEGRVVFSDEPTQLPLLSTPPKVDSSGSATSPISVISSPDTPRHAADGLPRPRGKIRYSTTDSRTAYTPPRALQPARSPEKEDKPIHPFFARDFRRTKSVPSPSVTPQRPRLIAHYSSTSASTQPSQDTASQGSSSSSWRVSNTTEIELVTHSFERTRLSSGSGTDGSEIEEVVEEVIRPQRVDKLDEVTAMLADLALPPPVRKPLTTPPSIPAGSKRPKLTTPKPGYSKPKPYFHYSNVLHPPRIAYTADPDEADDLLSCLTGNIVGFDMEWPISGTTLEGKKLGMKFDLNTKKWVFAQPPVALLQFCDERMVVLVHVWGMKRLPAKVVEILTNPEIFKIGVQIKGDGQKLFRDHPAQFQDGINSLLELSALARRADPVQMGPGKALISMANLVKHFLRIELDKEDSVRKGKWVGELDQKQRDYAANDVVVSMELYKRLMDIAKRNKNDINLSELSVDLSLNQEVIGPAAKSSPSTVIPPPAATIPDPVKVPELQDTNNASEAVQPKPSEWRALSQFKGGATVVQIARAGNVQESTVEGYILKAVTTLGPDILTLEQKKRFISEIAPDSKSRKYCAEALAALISNAGEAGEAESGDEQVGKIGA